jgi:hypothetical protein
MPNDEYLMPNYCIATLFYLYKLKPAGLPIFGIHHLAFGFDVSLAFVIRDY